MDPSFKINIKGTDFNTSLNDIKVKSSLIPLKGRKVTIEDSNTHQMTKVSLNTFLKAVQNSDLEAQQKLKVFSTVNQNKKITGERLKILHKIQLQGNESILHRDVDKTPLSLDSMVKDPNKFKMALNMGFNPEVLSSEVKKNKEFKSAYQEAVNLMTQEKQMQQSINDTLSKKEKLAQVTPEHKKSLFAEVHRDILKFAQEDKGFANVYYHRGELEEMRNANPMPGLDTPPLSHETIGEQYMYALKKHQEALENQEPHKLLTEKEFNTAVHKLKNEYKEIKNELLADESSDYAILKPLLEEKPQISPIIDFLSIQKAEAENELKMARSKLPPKDVLTKATKANEIFNRIDLAEQKVRTLESRLVRAKWMEERGVETSANHLIKVRNETAEKLKQPNLSQNQIDLLQGKLKQLDDEIGKL